MQKSAVGESIWRLREWQLLRLGASSAVWLRPGSAAQLRIDLAHQRTFWLWRRPRREFAAIVWLRPQRRIFRFGQSLVRF